MITRNSEDFGCYFDSIFEKIQTSFSKVKLLNTENKKLPLNNSKTAAKKTKKGIFKSNIVNSSSKTTNLGVEQIVDDIHRIVDEVTALKNFNSVIDSAINRTQQNLLNSNIDIFRKQLNKISTKSIKIAVQASLFEDISSTYMSNGKNPQEDSYCFCNFTAYGRMVSCENRYCRIKWFHFNCVGLKEEPKCLWFCSKSCLEKSNKGK